MALLTRQAQGRLQDGRHHAAFIDLSRRLRVWATENDSGFTCQAFFARDGQWHPVAEFEADTCEVQDVQRQLWRSAGKRLRLVPGGLYDGPDATGLDAVTA